MRVEFKCVCDLNEREISYLEDAGLLSDLAYRVGAEVQGLLNRLRIPGSVDDTTIWHDGEAR